MLSLPTDVVHPSALHEECTTSFLEKSTAKYTNVCGNFWQLLLQKGFVMIKEYVVNNNQTRNPGLHHEVHTREHARQLFIRNAISLGLCPNEMNAVVKAKRFYWDADGCAICCPRAHRG